MGNRMFQYSFGYILSKLKNCSFYHDSLPNFSIPSNMDAVGSLNNPINNLKFNAESFLSDIMQGYLDDNIIKNYNVNLKIQDKSKSQREALDHKISGEVSFSLFGNDNVFNNIAIDINNLLENINKNSYESNITITNI